MRVATPVIDGTADLVLGARDAEPGAWPWHLRAANCHLAGAVRRRTGVVISDLGPMRAARREDLLELGLRDRRFGWPLEMVLRAASAGWRIEEMPVAYRARVGRSKVTGTVEGRDPHGARHACRAAMTTIVVIAKEPRPGRVKTRLCPPCTPEGAATLAAAALADTLRAVAGASCTGRVLALDGVPGSWMPPGFTVVPQAAGELGHRLAAAVAAVAGPVLVVGMDTPQMTPALLDDACARLLAPATDAVLGLALDGGYWCIGFRHARGRRAAFHGVPMSSCDTGHRQRERLVALGMHVDDLRPLRDIDTIDDARGRSRR